MKIVNKGFTGNYLLIGLVALVLTGGVFYLGRISNQNQTQTSSPTQATPAPADKTANWKIYTFEKSNKYKLNQYAFTVKYPANWTIKELPLNPQEVSYKLQFFSPKRTYMDINIGPSTNIQTLKDQVENMEKYLDSPKIDTSNMSGFDQGIKLSGVMKPEATPEREKYDVQQVFLQKDQKIISLSLIQYPKEDYLSLFNQILSTFKFL